MKLLCALSLFLMVFTAWAEVSQDEVSSMLDKMVKEGTISAEEAQKARLKMKNMNGNEWSAINNQAEKMAAEKMASSRSPASAATVEPIKESKTGDLDKAQFHQIQDDMKKIIPEHR